MIAEVYIKKIDWFDVVAEEADVFFTFQGQDYWGFSQPCHFVESKVYKVVISPLILEKTEDHIFWHLNAKSKYRKIVPNGANRTNYLCYGKIISVSPVIINYGDLEFQYENWSRTSDASILGKYIYHVFDRLDIDAL